MVDQDLAGFLKEDFERGIEREQQQAAMERSRSIYIERRMGKGSINQVFYHTAGKRPFRLVFIRIRFRPEQGASQAASSKQTRIYVHREGEDEYGALLYAIEQTGASDSGETDLNFRVTREELDEPSQWSFGQGSGIRIEHEADNVDEQWGIEIGLAAASVAEQ